MAIALIKIGNNIKEIYGKQYINFQRLDDTIEEEFRVKEGIEKFILNIKGVDSKVTIINKPIDDLCYYNEYLKISNKAKYFTLRTLKDNEYLKIDGVNHKFINNSDLKIYKNYELILDKEFNLDLGDVIHFDDIMRIIIKEDKVLETKIFDKSKVYNYLPSYKGLKKEYKDFPVYTNSPKRNYKLEEEVINLELPPENEKKQKIFDIIKRLIPMIITFSLTMILAYFKPRGPYIIISASATVMTVTFTVITFIQDKKENRIFNQKRKELYNNYLYETRTKLNEKKEEELKIRSYKYLSYSNILQEIDNNTPRLYERFIGDEDFLKIRVGLFNDTPTYKITNPVKSLQIDKEEAEYQIEELYEDYKELENVPRVVDLFGRNIGMIGSSSIIKEQTYSYITQLMFFQSYLDIKIIYITYENEFKNYESYGYSRHSQLGEDRYYSFIYDASTRDSLLSGIIQTFRKREEESKEDIFLGGTIFIFVISNFELISNHTIMEFLNKNPLKYGFSILFQADREENLMNNVHTVLNFKNKYVLEVLSEDRVIKSEEIRIEELPNMDVEYYMRKMGQLEHVKGVQSAIPEAITYLEMYNVEKVRDLGIANRWKTNRTYKSIKALLGKKSETDYLYLDLHEKVHGPHGLVAGTTGSGKSEVMQTYILSLMTEYSPYEVGFLLIDYKGGGMANLFKDAPHLLGSITNLDGYQAMRAMASIKSELKRRQAIFGENDVNHINGYLKLFEKGIVKEPLPHLFLISDEFAELKANEPEFMKELVSAARIGRSLGVHLILATQKPTGVVDDQIWSNSKFKLCLKVAEESDSKELLKTPDAAYITQPGRGYLKVGTNELYELFQSGYSGADYSDNKEEHRDLRVFMLDKMGGKHLVNKKVQEVVEDEEEIDELGAVIKEVVKVHEEGNFIPVKKPWLPPLEREVQLNHNILDLDKQELNLKVNIGLIDLPDQQKQFPLEIDLIEEGNVGIFGGVQAGKTTTLKSIVLSLAQQNSPKNLCFYILDFGNSGLIALKGLKHTSDYITIDEEAKQSKLFKKIYFEIKSRKNKFANIMAANFKSYNELSDTKLPSIILVIDNYEALKDKDIQEMDKYTSILKEGASLGIYVVMGTYRFGTLKMAQQIAITKVIQHYTQDKGEANASLGKRSEYEFQEIPGRIQLKLEKPEVAQVYLPIKAESEKEIVVKTQEYISKINERTEFKNEGLPEMPEVVKYKEEYAKNNQIFIGLDYEDILPQYIGYEDLVIYGGTQKFKTHIVANILKRIKRSIYILDDSEYKAQALKIKGEIYESSQVNELLLKLETELDELIEKFNKIKEEKAEYTFYDYKQKVQGKVIYINQSDFLENLQLADKAKFVKILSDLSKIGYMIIYELNNIVEINDVTKAAKAIKQKIYVGDPAMQSIIKVPLKSRETRVGECYIYDSTAKLIKVESEL